MSQAANVRSLEAIREFRVALIKFIDKAKRSVATAESEVQRTSTWLSSTQPLHWTHEVRHANDRLAQAKSELARATLAQPDNPRGPTDQIRLVRKREEEIRIAMKKGEQTKKWSRKFEQQTNEYRGAMTPLSSCLDGDLNKAVSVLTNSVKSLEEYLASTTPTSELLEAEPAAESIARSGEDSTKDSTDEHVDSQSPTDEGDQDIDPSLG
jgi:hypothetical protein